MQLYVSASLARLRADIGPRRLTAAVSQPVRELPERNHADEDQADDQHAGDHLPALGCCVGQDREKGEHTAATLPESGAVGGERVRECAVAGGSPCELG